MFFLTLYNGEYYEFSTEEALLAAIDYLADNEIEVADCGACEAK